MNTRHGLALVSLLFLILTGCDARSDDRKEMRAVFARLNECNRAADGDGIVDVFTKSSFARNEELVKLGLDGTASQVKALPPNDMMEVLRMRLRSTRPELARLDGRGYVRYATSNGWYVRPPAELSDETLTGFTFTKDAREARAQVVSDGKKVPTRIHFIVEDNAWRYDEPEAMGEFDRDMHKWARQERMSIEELVLSLLEDELGKEIPSTVWDPMPGGQSDDKPPPPPAIGG
jgi:hypothetical protein